MKKFLIAASCAAMFAASPALAQASDDASFQISASVPGTCTIGNPGTVNLSSLNVNTTAGANALTLVASGEYVANVTNNFWVSCNDVNKMTISSANQGRLVRAGAAPTTEEAAQGFTDRIAYHVNATNYRPNTNWQFQPALNEGAVNNYQNSARGAIHQEVGMQVRIRNNQANAGKRPLAGTYSDTVTVTVQIAA